MLRRAVLVVSLGAGLALVGVAPAQAAFTVSVVGSTATITGDASPVDLLTIGKQGGNLTHDGNSDWDPVTGGVQTLPDAVATSVVVNAGDGIDIIAIDAPGNTFASDITVNGQGGTDFLTVNTGGSDSNSVWIDGNRVDLSISGQVYWDAATDQVNIRTGDGNDVINLDGTPTSPQVLVYGEGGADYLELADGAGLGAGGAFRGGPGTDTVDYTAYTTPVTVDLGKTARFSGELSAAATVPPSGSAATGFGAVEFTDLATNTFNYEVNADGLTAAQITDAHVHRGEAGSSNGATLLTIGPGTSWTNPGAGTTPGTEVDGVTDPDITEPALRAGDTYVDIHSTAHPAGDIRGQLTLDPNDGYGGSGTGIPRLFTVENVFSGQADDTLKGSVPHNIFECGGGHDSVSADLNDVLWGCETLLGGATVTGVSPASPADNPIPKVTGSTTPVGLDVKVRIYTNPTCSAPFAATGTAAQFAADGIPVPVADGSVTTFYATIVNTNTETNYDNGAESTCSSSSVSYQELAAKPTPAGTVSALQPKAKAKGAKVTIDTGSKASCPSGATAHCTATASATAKIGKKKVTLGGANVGIAPGQSTEITLKVKKSAAKAWREAGKLRITFTIQLTVPGGAPVTVTKTVRLKAPR